MSEPARPASAESSLVRSIGTVALAASIVNITIGGGIFRLPADMSATLGAVAPVAYLLCAVAMGLIVLCMAEAGSRVSLTGGPYALGDLGCFGDLGLTVAEALGVATEGLAGTSFAGRIGLRPPEAP